MTRLSRPARAAWWTFGLAVLTFVYLPLLVVAVNSVNADQTFAWPPSGFTLQWWSRAAAASGPREALLTSLVAGLGATALALVLGTLLALALARYDFFGQTAVNLLVILPIALPGIITGIALRSALNLAEIPFSFWTSPVS